MTATHIKVVVANSSHGSFQHSTHSGNIRQTATSILVAVGNIPLVVPNIVLVVVNFLLAVVNILLEV